MRHLNRRYTGNLLILVPEILEVKCDNSAVGDYGLPRLPRQAGMRCPVFILLWPHQLFSNQDGTLPNFMSQVKTCLKIFQISIIILLQAAGTHLSEKSNKKPIPHSVDTVNFIFVQLFIASFFQNNFRLMLLHIFALY